MIPQNAGIVFASVFLFAAWEGAESRNFVVADAATRQPLPSASVFNHRGKMIGVSNTKGITPSVDASDYPLAIRYLGYEEQHVHGAFRGDTVFLQESFTELPEFVVESRDHKLLHMLAYVREYSTMATYTDTVFLFREKMVDFMIPPKGKKRMDGWTTPRILKSRSYYRFYDAAGCDSVSSEINNHFSWTDWVGLPPEIAFPAEFSAGQESTYASYGRYSIAENWSRRGSRVSVDVDVLADSVARRWVPGLSTFFRGEIDFESLRARFNFDVSGENAVSAASLTGYSYNVDSRGRGHEMFRFNRVKEPFSVSSYAEVYILDKEFITSKEANRWRQRKFDTDGINIIEAQEAPDLDPEVVELISRVETLDTDAVRLGAVPDSRLMGKVGIRQSFGKRALQLLKNMTGISAVRSRQKQNKNWKRFRDQQKERNRRD